MGIKKNNKLMQNF